MKPIDRYRQVQNMREDADFQDEVNSDDAGMFFLKVTLALIFWVAVLELLGVIP